MPSPVHVKKAQQRFKMVPVLDEDGSPKRTPVMKSDGTQKTTKRGQAVFMSVTVADKSQPLPMPKCDYSGCKVTEDKTIEVGTPYKHLTYKSSATGSRTLTRHEECPSWNVWEYSSSASARVAQMIDSYETAVASCDDPDAVSEALAALAEEIRELATEKEESASAVEEGFNGPTSTSEALAEMAEGLNSWADEVENADVPSLEDHECEVCEGTNEVECETCGGEGEHEIEAGAGLSKCEDCDGTGKTECEECEEGHDMEAWREAVNDISEPQESPV